MPSAPSWMLFLQPNVPVKNCYCHESPPPSNVFFSLSHNMFEINIFSLLSLWVSLGKEGKVLGDVELKLLSIDGSASWSETQAVSAIIFMHTLKSNQFYQIINMVVSWEALIQLELTQRSSFSLIFIVKCP